MKFVKACFTAISIYVKVKNSCTTNDLQETRKIVTKLRVENLTKIFGNQEKEALNLMNQGNDANRLEIIASKRAQYGDGYFERDLESLLS